MVVMPRSTCSIWGSWNQLRVAVTSTPSEEEHLDIFSVSSSNDGTTFLEERKVGGGGVMVNELVDGRPKR